MHSSFLLERALSVAFLKKKKGQFNQRKTLIRYIFLAVNANNQATREKKNHAVPTSQTQYFQTPASSLLLNLYIDSCTNTTFFLSILHFKVSKSSRTHTETQSCTTATTVPTAVGCVELKSRAFVQPFLGPLRQQLHTVLLYTCAS